MLPEIDERLAQIAKLPIRVSNRGLQVGAQSVVERWEEPIQQALAAAARESGVSILEIGYSLGLCAQAVSQLSPEEHLIIECHPDLAEQARAALPRARVIVDLWERALLSAHDTHFDAVIFDAYPIGPVLFEGRLDQMMGLVRPVLMPASKVLRPGGRLLFLDFTGELPDAITADPHYLDFYQSIDTLRVPLAIPPDCSYAGGSSGWIVSLTR